MTIYYQVMTGDTFELEVHDGDTINATNITLVNQSTGVNQAVTPTSSSGNELYIRFRYNGRNGASVKFVITDGKGKNKNLLWILYSGVSHIYIEGVLKFLY